MTALFVGPRCRTVNQLKQAVFSRNFCQNICTCVFPYLHMRLGHLNLLYVPIACSTVHFRICTPTRRPSGCYGPRRRLDSSRHRSVHTCLSKGETRKVKKSKVKSSGIELLSSIMKHEVCGTVWNRQPFYALSSRTGCASGLQLLGVQKTTLRRAEQKENAACSWKSPCAGS